MKVSTSHFFFSLVYSPEIDIMTINGATGLDQWGHGAFQHHNADQSRFQPARAAHARLVKVSGGGYRCVVGGVLQMG